jgi:CheY-like chemotaxis protein
MKVGVETAKAVDQRRVFVVDTDEITRAVLQFMLQDEIETRELVSLEDAFEKGAGWLKPDVVLLGVGLLKAQGAGVVGAVMRAFPGVRIVIVTDKADEATALQGLREGAHGGGETADAGGGAAESGYGAAPRRGLATGAAGLRRFCHERHRFL